MSFAQLNHDPQTQMPRHSRNLKPTVVIVLLFLLLLAGAGLVLYLRMSGMAKQKGFQFVAAVKTAPVQIRALPMVYQTIGTLEANRQVVLHPETSGVVRQIAVEEGQWVQEGQPLLRLGDDKQMADMAENLSASEEAQANLSSLEAAYRASQETVKTVDAEQKLAASDYNRYQTLWKNEFVSAQEVEQRQTQWEVQKSRYETALRQLDSDQARLHQAKAAIDSARARVRRAQAQHADTVLRAPFAGQVGVRTVEVGDYVSSSQNLLTLVQVTPLKVTFSLPEAYLEQLKPNLPVTLQSESHAGKTFKGSLTFIDPVVSSQTREVLLKAVIQNPDNILRPGQLGQVTLVLGQKPEARVIPEESLIPQGEKYFVYVVNDGKAKFRSVEVGIRTPGWVEITAGLTPEDRVIVGGLQKVQDGVPVTDISEKPVAPAVPSAEKQR